MTTGTMEVLPDGGVTSPKGFSAGAVHVGVRTDWDKLDVALLYSEAQCNAAGVYTSNRLKAAPVLVTQNHLADGKAQAVVVNAGCANAATGRPGVENAVKMAQVAGRKLNVDPHDVVVASTGVIGVQLPMDRIIAGIEKIELSAGGGVDFAVAIMTTDTAKKHIAVKCGRWTIGGAVKGSGMIHPNMGTMLCFLTTDAPVEPGFLGTALKEAVDASFNMVDVDSDTSTNDTAVIMANGLAGGEIIDAGGPEAEAFQEALTSVCIELAKRMMADAEGSSKVIECNVEGAASLADARKAAREVVRSLAVKTAVYGRDPNWGRILAAVGNSGAKVDWEKMSLYLASPAGGEICLYADGGPVSYDVALAKACLEPDYVRIRIGLSLGAGNATAWGSDLTEDYVRLNSEYTT